MFLKWIKRHKTKILATGICSIAMALFTIISFNCKTYAFTIDSNGNLVGENLIQNSNNITLENQAIVLNCELQNNTTYTFSIQNGTKTGNYALALYNGNQYINITSGTIVTNDYTFTTTSVSQRIYIYANNIQNCDLMLNLGNEAKNWEPYGVWYSQQNYNTLEDMYNSILDSTYPFKKDKININSVIFNGQDITNEYKQDYDYTIDFQDTTITINSRDFEYLPNYNDDIYGYELLQMICTYEKPVQLTDVLAKSALSAVKESYCNITFYLNTQIVTHLYLDNDVEDTDTQMLTGSTCTFNKIIFEIRISQDETQYNNYTTISSGGNFAQGYAQAATRYNEQIQSLSNEVSKRDNQILKLKEEITTTAQTQYNTGYQDGYNVGASSNNTLYNMVIRS